MQEFRRSVWIGFLWSIVFGTVLHFLYGWTGENRVVGLYAAISESPWEHLKLLFFPVLVYTVWEVHLGGTPLEGLHPDAGRGSTAGHADHYCSLLHLYRHLRQALALADILTFVLGAAVTAFWTWKHTPHAKGGSWLGILLFAGVAVCFGIFSLFPRRWGYLPFPEREVSQMNGLVCLLVFGLLAITALAALGLCRRLFSHELPRHMATLALLENPQQWETQCAALAAQLTWTDATWCGQSGWWTRHRTARWNRHVQRFCSRHKDFCYCRLSELTKIFGSGTDCEKVIAICRKNRYNKRSVLSRPQESQIPAAVEAMQNACCRCQIPCFPLCRTFLKQFRAKCGQALHSLREAQHQASPAGIV